MGGEIMSKQSSVEWLANQLFPDNEIFGWSKDLMQQAKAMHKQEIIDAYAQGFIESEMADKGAEQHYNQTFKQ